MSNEHNAHAKALCDRWGDALSPERQRALDACVQEWEQSQGADRSEQSGPFAAQGNRDRTGGRLTGADVFYLAVRALADELCNRHDAEAWLLGDYSQEHPPLHWFLSSLHLEGADLSGAQLERAVLLDAHLERANLSGANLQEAVLDGVHLERACLADADLRWADLVGSYLMGADLSRARLEGVNLTNARLADANLDGTHLDDAIIEDAHLEGVDLSRAAPLDRKRWTLWQRWRKRASF